MPYVKYTTTEKLSDAQRVELKAGFGRLMSTIPGKTEAKLMVAIEEGDAMYFGGEAKPLAFIDARFSGSIAFEHKKAFTEAAFRLAEQVCGLDKASVYLTFSEFDSWGTGGTLAGR